MRIAACSRERRLQIKRMARRIQARFPAWNCLKTRQNLPPGPAPQELRNQRAESSENSGIDREKFKQYCGSRRMRSARRPLAMNSTCHQFEMSSHGAPLAQVSHVLTRRRMSVPHPNGGDIVVRFGAQEAQRPEVG
jgi:hypothetical protein